VTRFAVFIATAGYCGYFPIAPGTVGSAAGLLVYLLVSWAGLPMLDVAAIGLTFAGGAWAATHAERFFGGIDPGPVVIDEVLGMLVTLAFIPAGWQAMLAGFLLFRVFDVIKPFPANRLETLHGGFGIMADDAMAGVYANLGLRGLIWLLPDWFQ
jgi:phosphatidylglycerophosphatase A